MNFMTYMRSAFITGVLTLSLTSNANALCGDSASLIDLACQRVSETWAKGSSDLYLPFHTYHLRSAYSEEQIDSYREDTWGLGYGRSRYVDGNWDGVYGMAFLDSNNNLEPIIGYAHQWMWGDQESLHAGLGYTAFITARSDSSHYVPLPGVLPIASVNYDKASVNATFVPGTKGNNNVFFFWSRFNF